MNTVVAIATAIVTMVPALSTAADRCAGRSTTEVQSMRDLPMSLRALLPSADHGPNGIADHGGRFNATDVVDHNLPGRRFTLAAVASTCAVIAIEYGGIATGYELTEYRLLQGHWQRAEHLVVYREPRTIADLLGAR
jgi:hypothetical protein